LPPYSHLIVDEAHRLEEATTEQLTYRVDRRGAQSLLARLVSDGDLLPALLRHAGALERWNVEILKTLTDEIANKAKRGLGRLNAFLDTLLHFAQAQDEIRQDSHYAQRLRLDSALRTQPVWSEIEAAWEQAGQILRDLFKKLDGIVKELEQARWQQEEPFATFLNDFARTAEQLNELVQWLDAIIFQSPAASNSEVVTWLEVNEGNNEASLSAAPLHIHEILEKELIHQQRSVIFTGATLRTGAGFGFIRDRLGLWGVAASTVESPFDYRASTLLYLPSDLPEPNQMHYQQAVENAIVRAAAASDGGALALFTSYAQLRVTADAIRAPLDRLGITVLQHGDSSRQRLLREYRQTERAVLLGTRSFWEGVDLPGDELRCLLIVRLPFAVPTDPLVAARSAEFDNPFQEYTLPDAILRFRQGFGRLIRRATDRGIVVVLDSRLWRKEYGQAFLESLPECTTRHAPLSNLGSEIEQWLNKASAKA
jgi:DNA polymerase-3 subunit epsilon/ATP-dependent DNA helicase DinG